MIKILYILTKSGIGGAQKYIKDLTENLDKEKFEAKIIYGRTDIKHLSNKTYPWLLFLNDWIAVFELVKILKKEKPDIIHLNSSKAGVIGSIAVAIYNSAHHISPITVIFTAHGWVFNHTNELDWFSRTFYMFLHKISAKFQDKIICVSEYDYKLAIENDICPREKLSIIHNGVNDNIKFLKKNEARTNLKFKIKNLKFNDNWPWIGSIGRLVKEKNYETFIATAKSIPNAYFFIIGEGTEYKNLKSKIKKSLTGQVKLNNRFFIIPPTGNDSIYLKAFDIFVMSSIKEGLPYILLEAMSAELPIVITEAGGMPELIKNHENGLMVAQKNPEALAKAIGGLIENQPIAKELAKKAKEVVKEKFGLERMIKETENVYLKI
ncbi:glycosyltransferase [Patescibacteria group bacterium]|nr:glycosyltransferase [Patescibacteria group bacterium]